MTDNLEKLLLIITKQNNEIIRLLGVNAIELKKINKYNKKYAKLTGIDSSDI